MTQPWGKKPQEIQEHEEIQNCFLAYVAPVIW